MRARRNVQGRYNRLLSKGYIFSSPIIPDIPKRITPQSINRLNKLTSKYMREKATYGVDVSTGEIVSAKQAYISQRRETAQRQSQAQRRRQPRPQKQTQTKEEFYAKQNEIIDRHIANLRDKLLSEYGISVPASWNAIDIQQYWNYVRRGYGPHKDIIKDTLEQEKSVSPDNIVHTQDDIDVMVAIETGEREDFTYSDEYEGMSKEDFDTEIANAYDTGEVETARDLQKARDILYPTTDEYAEVPIEDRFLAAIEIIYQYSPEIAERLKDSFDTYMTRTGDKAFSDLSGKREEDFEDAIGELEDVKYASNAMALWGIYTKLDKAINSRRHGAAEKRAFFGRLQSGDFNYE
jgi:hypothetical protein